jgi:glycosyltransferase involved in cell wall biosynthesis
MKDNITVCYFGSHKEGYSRNSIIKQGLVATGYDIIECNSRANILIRNLILFFKFITIRKNIDIIIVSEMGHASMPIAKLISKLFNKKIIFDPLISAYDTIVEDRKLVPENSIIGSLIFNLDKASFKLADYILADTNEHKDYFAQKFGIGKEKIKKIIVGADTKYYFPAVSTGSKKSYKFNILFQGTYIPLHGIKYIVDAAYALRDEKEIIFTLIGNGQMYNDIVKYSENLRINNINFLPIITQDELRNKIVDSDLCLGIFGDTEKATRVIPNKVYQYLACGKPIITGDSKAIRELLEHNNNVYLCNFADSDELANSIKRLYEDQKLREKLSVNAYKLFSEYCTHETIGKQVSYVIQKCLGEVEDEVNNPDSLS